MPTIRERASEALKLLEHAQTSADTLSELKVQSDASLAQLMERDAIRISSQKAFDSTSRQVGLTSAEMKQIEARRQEGIDKQDQYNTAASNIKARADKLELSPQQQFLARQSGELGAVLNTEMREELTALTQRVLRAGEKPRENPAVQQLKMDIEVFRQHEVGFMERYGHKVQYKPNGTALLPWDTDYQPAKPVEGGPAPIARVDEGRIKELRSGGLTSFLRGTAGKIGSGVLGGAGIVASAVGLEEEGAALAGAGADFNEFASAPNIADRAAELEMGDIIGRASLKPEDPRYLSPKDAAFKAIAMATDFDAAQNIAGSVIGAAAGGGVGTALLKGGAKALAKGGAALTGTTARTVAPAGAAAQGISASLAGAGQGVDESLTTDQAQILGGGAILSGSLGALGNPVETALGQTVRSLTPGLNRTLPRSGATSTLGGVGRGTVTTGATELVQGGIDNAAESFGQSAQESGAGVLETLENPQAQADALLAAQVNAPLEAFAGGATGSVTGGIEGFQGGRQAAANEAGQKKQEAEDARAAQVDEAIATQQARANAARAKNFKDRGIDLGQGPNDPKATLRNTYVDDIEAEANFEALRDVPADVQELSLRALYRSQDNLDNAGEDAFIEEFFKEGAMPGDTTYLDFLDKLDVAATSANSPETLGDDQRADIQARKQQREAQAQAEQEAAENQQITDLQETLTAATTERDGVIDENPSLDTPYRERGAKGRVPATFQTEYLNDTTGERVRELLDAEQPDQISQLRALYRNAELEPTGETQFVRAMLNTLNAIGGDVTPREFDRALSAASIAAGNPRGAAGVRTGEAVITPEQEAANREARVLERQAQLTRKVKAGDTTRETTTTERAQQGRETFDTRFFEKPDSLSNLQELISQDPETREATIRALYRNQDNLKQNPKSEDIFTSTVDLGLDMFDQNGTLNNVTFEALVRAAHQNAENDGRSPDILKGLPPTKDAEQAAEQKRLENNLRDLVNWQAINNRAANEDIRREEQLESTLIPERIERLEGATLTSSFFGDQAESNLAELVAEDPSSRDITVRAMMREDPALVNVDEDAMVEALVGLPDNATIPTVRQAIANVVSGEVNTRRGKPAPKTKTRPQVIKIFDNIQKATPKAARPENELPQDLNPATGRLVRSSDPARAPAELQENAVLTASVSNTLLAEPKAATQTQAGTVNTTEAAMLQLLGLSTTERGNAYKELAKRDGLNATEQGLFANAMGSGAEILSGSVGSFQARVSQAFVAAGGVPAANKATGFYQAVNSLVTTGTDVNSSAEGVFEVSSGGKAVLTPEAQATINQLEKERDAKIPMAEDKVSKGYGAVRNKVITDSKQGTFTEPQAVVMLRNIHILERASAAVGKGRPR